MEINRDYEYRGGGEGWCSPTHVAVHYTAGARGVTAESNAAYFRRCGEGSCVGAHYFVGDDGVYASTPEDMGAWANGNYAANTHCVSIEVACGTDEPCFTGAERAYLRELVLDVMERHGIPAGNVIRHHDVADVFDGPTLDPHKACPRPYIDQDAWEELHSYITTEGEPDMELTDMIIDDGYIMGGTSYASVGNCIYWGEQNAEKALEVANSTAAKVEAVAAKVDKLAIGGATVDYDRLAEAVCDRMAARMKE